MKRYRLIRQSKIDYILKNAGYKNLSIIPVGSISPNLVEMASSVKTGELFMGLKKKFDYIIVDNVRLGSVSDSFSLTSVVDVIIILVHHFKTIKKYSTISSRMENLME